MKSFLMLAVGVFTAFDSPGAAAHQPHRVRTTQCNAGDNALEA